METSGSGGRSAGRRGGAVALAALAALLGTHPSHAAPGSPGSPPPRSETEALLEQRFRSWRVERCIAFENGVSLYTAAYSRRVSFPATARIREAPCQVSGDWDGDGTRDAAVQLVRRDGTSARRIVVAVFQRGGGLLAVYAGEGGDTLGVAKKGTSDHDYETEGRVRYENDAVYVGLDEAVGWSLVFRDGRFLVFHTGD